MSTVSVSDLSFAYGSHSVIKGISFEVYDSEFVSILGKNGAGKSTLFKCMLGLLPGYSGSVSVNGKNISSMTHRQIAREIAYIPQQSSPVFNYSVEDMVLFGTTARLSGISSPNDKEMQKVTSALEKMHIAHLRNNCFHHLSGGEKQLVLIARALAQDAHVLMLDEPTASLDFGNQTLVLKQVRKLADEGYTIIQTTHSPEHSYMYSDKVLALSDGHVLKFGNPKDVITADTIGRIYGVDVEITSLYDDKVRICTATF